MFQHWPLVWARRGSAARCELLVLGRALRDRCSGRGVGLSGRASPVPTLELGGKGREVGQLMKSQ